MSRPMRPPPNWIGRPCTPLGTLLTHWHATRAGASVPCAGRVMDRRLQFALVVPEIVIAVASLIFFVQARRYLHAFPALGKHPGRQRPRHDHAHDHRAGGDRHRHRAAPQPRPGHPGPGAGAGPGHRPRAPLTGRPAPQWPGAFVPNSSRAFRVASASAVVMGAGGLSSTQARKSTPITSMMRPTHSPRLIPAALLMVAGPAARPAMVTRTPKITNSAPMNERRSKSLASRQLRASSGVSFTLS